LTGSTHEPEIHRRRSQHHRIVEQETTFLPALELFPALSPDPLAENRDWMRKARAIDADDVLIL
jgi:hypothetical protein